MTFIDDKITGENLMPGIFCAILKISEISGGGVDRYMRPKDLTTPF